MNFLVSRRALVARDVCVSVAPGGKVLRLAEHAAWVPAQALLAEARREAAAVQAQSQEAYEAARLQGYQDGREAALKDQACEMLRLEGAKATFIASVEQQMVDLVMSAVRKIVFDFDDDARVFALVRGALAVVRAQRRVLLKVRPADAAGLRGRIQALLAGFPGIDYLDVMDDDQIPGGTCRLETDAGAVVAGLECQLQALREAFERALQADDSGDRPCAAAQTGSPG